MDEQPLSPMISEGQEESMSEPLVNAANYPLYVVTASAEGESSGCLAGFVTQSSIKPVQFLVCISKVNPTFGIAQRCEGLALHLLGSVQRDVASLFGELSGDEIDKFERVEWSRGTTGAPILSECAAWIEDRVIDRMSVGDHEALLITVSDGGAGTHDGRFMLTDASHFEPGLP